MSVDSGTCDGPAWPDLEPNDYTNKVGTSVAAPFVAGCAGLVIDALQQKRLEAGADPNDLWDFYSSDDALFVKMVLCATATETNESREDEDGLFSPTLQRAEPGPMNYPVGKDPYEGYGIVNADAAVEAVFLEYEWGSSERDVLGEDPADRRAWARRVVLSPEIDCRVILANPPDGDFDLYLYSGTPNPTGTPRILASSTNAAPGDQESIAHTPAEQDDRAILVVKRVTGWGQFQLTNPN